MGSVNCVHLVGNLGRDAEVRYTNGGQSVANFSLATTQVWNDKSGEKKERTDWHRCQLWGKQAESLEQYLKKGKQIYVQGQLVNGEYEKDGVKHHTTEIRVDRVVLLGGGERGGEQRPAAAPATRPAHSGPDIDDSIPF